MTENEQDWETEEVRIERPIGVVVSARLPQETAERVFAEAQRRGVPTSAIVREALELFLDGGPTTSSLDLVISSVDAPVAFLTGRSSVGRTGAAPARVEFTHTDPRQLALGA